MHTMSTYNIALCRRRLKEKGWDQKDLADEELSESAVSKFFRGESVRNSTAATIIQRLGLRVKDVLQDDEAIGAGYVRKRA